jgi:hypothetical protein
VLGVAVLGADPFRGLLMPDPFQDGQFLGGGVLARPIRRRLDLVGAVSGQAQIAGVDLGPDLWELLEQISDALHP